MLSTVANIAFMLPPSVMANPEDSENSIEFSLELLQYLGEFSEADGELIDPETMQPLATRIQCGTDAQPQKAQVDSSKAKPPSMVNSSTDSSANHPNNNAVLNSELCTQPNGAKPTSPPTNKTPSTKTPNSNLSINTQGGQS